MKRLTITIDNDSNALLLFKVLSSLNFVEKVENEQVIANKDSQPEVKTIKELKKLLSTIKKDEVFSEITDRVQWQKNLRNEWR